MENFKLVFVRDVGVNNGIYEYDFYFSKNPDEFWGLGFDCQFANQDETLPDEKTYDNVLRLKTTIPFFCMQHNRCFSMQHVVNGIVAVAFEDISDYDEYPEPFRIVFKYGEDYDSVEEKLASRHQFFDEF
jgi:hypothetical protein